ncbi:MAG: peptide-methionine (S)-S-oxide reductase MsrA [Myxococcota bacterium]
MNGPDPRLSAGRLGPALLVPLALLLSACGGGDAPRRPASEAAAPADPQPAGGEARHIGATVAAPPAPEGKAVAVFAGGCFWCMEAPFERLEGVESVLSGYAGGREVGPSYQDVSHGHTGHLESVRVLYDPAQVGYARLLEVFFVNVDPTQDDGQFCDRGAHYRTAIFVGDDEERRLAEAARAEAQETLGRPVVTELREAGPFYVAEDYHQDFYRTNPGHYRRYREGCGRDRRLQELWGERAPHH